MNKRLCQSASFFVIGMGCLVLLGWQLDIPLLKSGFPGSVSTMKPNTALGFVLSGISLRLLQSQRVTRVRHQIAKWTALLVLMIGLLTISEYYFNWNLGIDQLLGKDLVPSEMTPSPGRMGINTAVNFILMAIALLWLEGNKPKDIVLAQILSSMAAIISLLALLGHLLGVSVLAQLTVYTTTQALHTAVTFLVLYGGLLLVQPERGLMQVLTSPLIGGRLARRLILWVILFPLALNMLVLQGYEIGWYDIKAAYGIEATFTIVSFFLFVWGSAYWLNQIEIARLNAQKALTESQQQFQQAIEAANLGTWKWDILTGKVSFSSQSEALFGLKPGSFGGTDEALINLLHGDDFDALSNSLQVSLLNVSRWQRDYQILDPDGSKRWITSVGKFLYDTAGEAVQMIGIVKDITPRKQAEFNLTKLNETLEKRVSERTAQLSEVNHQLQEQLLERQRIEIALRSSQARLSGILEIASDAIVSVDNTQKIILFNQAAEQIFGYSIEDVLGQPLSLLLPDEFKIAHHHHVTKFAQGSGTKRSMGKRGEISGRRKNGTEFPAEASISKLEVDHEIILTVILQDISERKKIEEALRKSEERWQLALRGNNDGIWDWNITTNEVFFSTRWKEMLGYQDHEIANHLDEWFKRIHPDDWEWVTKEIQAHFARQIPFYISEHRVLCKDGSYKWILDRGQALWDENGQVVRMAGSHTDITGRKQAEEELRQMSIALENAVEGISQLDSQGRYLAVNKAYGDMLGYQPEEMIGKGWQPTVHPEYQAQMRLAYQTMLNEGKVEAEVKGVRRDGSVFYKQVTMISAYNQQQKFIGHYCFAKDITERKQIENALQATTTLQKAIFDSANYTIISTSIDGTIVTFNAAASRLLGYSAQEVIGKTTPVIIHDRDEVVQRAQELSTQMGIVIEPGFEAFVANARLGKPDEYEWSYIRKDGSRFPVLLSVTALRDAQGNITGFLGIGSDITERKQAEANLRESEERLQLALEASGDGLWDWNLETKEVYYSPRYLEMLGYEVDEFPQHETTWERLIHPDDMSRAKKILNHHLKNSSVSYAFDYRMRTQSGEWKWIADYGKVVAWDKKGKAIRMLGTHKDISERKRVEFELQKAKEEAIAASQSKSIFLANMSHELRTPLNAILGFTQLLARDHSLNSFVQQRLQIINRSGEHLLGLINDILDLSKIEIGQIGLVSNDFDLSHLLVTVQEMLRSKAEAKGLELIIEQAPNLPRYLKTDEKKLCQVLINLLGNGIKFTHQGNVTLRVKPKPGKKTPYRLLFEVEDTGVGIAPDELDSLFKMFVQAEAGRNFNQGTGLGLAISQKLVQLMGSKIEVKSRLGKGSIFSFEIEIELASGANFQEELLNQKVIGLKGGQPNYRILVVEDVLENRCLLVELLTTIGFEVREATNGAQALNIWESWSPHLIWMDIRMPVMNGYEATKRIKQHPSGQSTVIIALTASVLSEERETILAAGCHDMVSKPFTEAVIFRKLTQYLGVQYIYETGPQTGENISLAEVSTDVLSTLSDEWLEQMYQAAYCLDADVMQELIEQIPASKATLAKALEELLNNFQTERILELTRPLIANPLE